ncbi:MAG TPA: lasso peptide biosynthesis PqqD family chaperone [Porticoccaceae bacterium]|nr:lasso peptide biosynthesis PqqD family chaperone [Porticoccaceae bacterium]HIK80622.1 lasso peptide biosynthesis PqqD family chaperone [Porticoccaceae bacterium]
MTREISTQTTIQRQQGMIQAVIDGETIMMNVENGEYYGLDSIASRIWELIETPQTVGALKKQLLEEFAVDDAQCQNDVIQFLTEMGEKKIITYS